MIAGLNSSSFYEHISEISFFGGYAKTPKIEGLNLFSFPLLPMAFIFALTLWLQER